MNQSWIMQFSGNEITFFESQEWCTQLTFIFSNPQGTWFPREPLRLIGANRQKKSPYIKERESQNTFKRNSPWLFQRRAFNDIMETLTLLLKINFALLSWTKKIGHLHSQSAWAFVAFRPMIQKSIANKAAYED